MSDDWSLIEAALDLVCPRCDARAGQVCRTINGRSASPHSRRWQPLATAFGQGYEEGRRDSEERGLRRAARQQAASSNEVVEP